MIQVCGARERERERERLSTDGDTSTACVFLEFFEREIIAPKKSVWMRVKERFHIHDKDVPAQEEDVNISLRCERFGTVGFHEK